MSERENRLRPGPRPSVPGTLACLLFGPILWAVQFTVVYASHTLVCSQGGSAPAGHGIVIGTSVALAAAIIAFLLLPERFARGLGCRRAWIPAPPIFASPGSAPCSGWWRSCGPGSRP